MKNYILKCSKCQSESCFATLPVYIKEYASKGCESCSSSESLEYRLAAKHEIPGNSEPEIPSIAGARSLETDEGFKDVLRKIKEAHPLATFDV